MGPQTDFKIFLAFGVFAGSGNFWGHGLAAAQAGVVAAGYVFEVVVEDPGLAVDESDFHEREAPHHGGILFLHHPPSTPLRVLVVNDPIPHFQV